MDTGTPPFHSRIGSTITTPVAYLTSLPRDPFAIFENFLAGSYPDDVAREISGRFPYWNFHWFDEAFGPPSMIRAAGNEAAGAYLLYSAGPDTNVNNGGGTGSFYVPYDATNGTVSQGNIFRTQADPEGLRYGLFRELAGF